MYPYILLFAIASLFAFGAKKASSHRALAILFALTLAVFVSTRYEVGCDFTGYENRFLQLQDYLSWGAVFEQGEAGFHLLSLLVLNLGLPYTGLLFLSGLIYIFCLARFSRLTERPLTFLALCFPVLVIQLGMSGIRQALALGFLLLAFAAFADKKRLAMAVWILVASQFHTSAIIFLPLVYLIGRAVSLPRLIVALVVLGPVVAWLIGDRLSIYSDRYVEQIYGENSSSGAWFRYALVLGPFVLFEWKRALIEAAYPKIYPLLRVFSLITFALVLVGALSSVALHRMVFYVMPISILVLICLSRVMAGRKTIGLVMASPFLIYGLYFASWLTLSRHATLCYNPYNSWLF
ncbi:MAG: hypothetical protein CL625_05415 [Arenimonas sp.]|nr:hypothetical protein [Arenimonas sp.]